ncbi:MAG: hypothetical protein ACRCX7_08865 [Cetobacterium sp.]|uniref:hypothetical protein n=1 Tax=Cetobacterium sp. TaxID=2071632 RepID=UPI003EE55018
MKYNIKYFLIELFFKGWIPLIILAHLTNLFFYGEFATIKLTIKSFVSQIILSLVIMYLLKGFKGLFKEFKEMWIDGNIGQRIFIILGWIFVVYGVYYRAKISGSFK